MKNNNLKFIHELVYRLLNLHCAKAALLTLTII